MFVCSPQRKIKWKTMQRKCREAETVKCWMFWKTCYIVFLRSWPLPCLLLLLLLQQCWTTRTRLFSQLFLLTVLLSKNVTPATSHTHLAAGENTLWWHHHGRNHQKKNGTKILYEAQKKKKDGKFFKIHQRNQNTGVRDIQRKFGNENGMATGPMAF